MALWRDFPGRLQAATGRRVLAFSRWGHGRSEPPPAPRTPAFFHEEALEVLPELLSQLDAPEPILVGHSDGASIALIHAGRHRVTGLALLAPHVVVEDVTVAAIRETRVAYLDDGSCASAWRATTTIPTPPSGAGATCGSTPISARGRSSPTPSAVTAPALLIQGADDPYGTLDQIDRVETCVRGPVERLVMPGGHSPHLEQPAAVVAAIAAFAGRLA